MDILELRGRGFAPETMLAQDDKATFQPRYKTIFSSFDSPESTLEVDVSPFVGEFCWLPSPG